MSDKVSIFAEKLENLRACVAENTRCREEGERAFLAWARELHPEAPDEETALRVCTAEELERFAGEEFPPAPTALWGAEWAELVRVAVRRIRTREEQSKAEKARRAEEECP